MNPVNLPALSQNTWESRAVRQGDTVRVDVMVWREDGTLIYSSVFGPPLIVTAGRQPAIPGLEALLIGMCVGESKTETFSVDSALAPDHPEHSCHERGSRVEVRRVLPLAALSLALRRTGPTQMEMIVTGMSGDAGPHVAECTLIVQLDLIAIVNPDDSAPRSTNSRTAVMEAGQDD